MMRPNPANCPCPAKCDEAQTCQGRCSEPVPKPSSEPSDLARRAIDFANAGFPLGMGVSLARSAQSLLRDLATALLAAEREVQRIIDIDNVAMNKLQAAHTELAAQRDAALTVATQAEAALKEVQDRFAKLLAAAQPFIDAVELWDEAKDTDGVITPCLQVKHLRDLAVALAAFDPQPATREREG